MGWPSSWTALAGRTDHAQNASGGSCRSALVRRSCKRSSSTWKWRQREQEERIGPLQRWAALAEHTRLHLAQVPHRGSQRGRAGCHHRRLPRSTLDQEILGTQTGHRGPKLLILILIIFNQLIKKWRKIKDEGKNGRLTPIIPRGWTRTAGSGAGIVATGPLEQKQAELAWVESWLTSCKRWWLDGSIHEKMLILAKTWHHERCLQEHPLLSLHYSSEGQPDVDGHAAWWLMSCEGAESPQDGDATEWYDIDL